MTYVLGYHDFCLKHRGQMGKNILSSLSIIQPVVCHRIFVNKEKVLIFYDACFLPVHTALDAKMKS